MVEDPSEAPPAEPALEPVDDEPPRRRRRLIIDNTTPADGYTGAHMGTALPVGKASYNSRAYTHRRRPKKDT
ncbi:hypothetical protein [Streptomyces sp. JNUCC 63]